VHPCDDDDGDAAGPATGVYVGAAGVCWALDRLAVRGWAQLSAPWRARAGALVEIARATPETGTRAPSYFLGEAGVLAVADRDPDALFAVIESNIEHPAVEPLWAAPGTMLPALFHYRRTGEARWRELWLRNYRHLIDRWQYAADAGCYLWTQHLYGEVVRITGAGHGFAGNAHALLCGLDLLPADEAAVVVGRARDTLLATAIRRDGLANWLPHVGPARAGREAILVQWCHGAPGMVTSLAALPADPDTDRVLEEAGAMTWHAGPLAKGPGLCHGTAGNGYALLKLHQRTGDAVWLERARRFAMHAIGQSEPRARSIGGAATRCGPAISGSRCTSPTARTAAPTSRRSTRCDRSGLLEAHGCGRGAPLIAGPCPRPCGGSISSTERSQRPPRRGRTRHRRCGRRTTSTAASSRGARARSSSTAAASSIRSSPARWCGRRRPNHHIATRTICPPRVRRPAGTRRRSQPRGR